MGDLASQPNKATASRYSDLLTALRVLDPIEAWLPTRNQFARLTGAPKHHLADPALAARLLSLTDRHLIAATERSEGAAHDGTFLGALFESLVALSVRTYAQSFDGRTYHLRTQGGRHEVDLIVETDHGVLGIEVKLGASPDDRDVRHLTWLRERLGADLLDAVVVTTGPEAFRRSDGIAVVPLALLGP